MDNLSELIGLYGLDSLPRELQKQRELKRWREIMAEQRYEQDYLDKMDVDILKLKMYNRQRG